MSKKKSPYTWQDTVFWWGNVLGMLFSVACLAPPVNWRWSQMNPNYGQRFVVDRRISLFTTSNQYSQMMAWFRMKTVMCQYNTEIHRPNPLKMGLGLAAAFVGGESGKGVPGSALGCDIWQECKAHTMQRCHGYLTIAGIGIGTFFCIIVATVSAGMGLVFLGKESSCKKKKKKKHAQFNTCTAGCCAFGFSFFGHLAWVLGTDVTFNSFKAKAYYPFPHASVGIFLHAFVCFIFFIVALCGYFRMEGKKKKEEEDEDGDGEESEAQESDAFAYGAQGYGQQPYAPGAYGAPPPGPYGAPPPGPYGMQYDAPYGAQPMYDVPYGAQPSYGAPTAFGAQASGAYPPPPGAGG